MVHNQPVESAVRSQSQSHGLASNAEISGIAAENLDLASMLVFQLLQRALGTSDKDQIARVWCFKKVF